MLSNEGAEMAEAEAVIKTVEELFGELVHAEPPLTLEDVPLVMASWCGMTLAQLLGDKEHVEAQIQEILLLLGLTLDLSRFLNAQFRQLGLTFVELLEQREQPEIPVWF